ncbi:MAG TPA: hypothetical protein VJ740_05985 [Hyphomicrobiaceae bacterium]|nr:hypothetical protein [Hyphomicrobiaceae bacterium]
MSRLSSSARQALLGRAAAGMLGLAVLDALRGWGGLDWTVAGVAAAANYMLAVLIWRAATLLLDLPAARL